MSVFEKLAKISVTHKPYSASKDALGNTTDGYGTSVTRLVYSIGPHVELRGSATITETAVADVDIAMPKAQVALRDLFEFGDGPHRVVGIRDMTRGFHGWQPGIVVELEKVR